MSLTWCFCFAILLFVFLLIEGERGKKNGYNVLALGSSIRAYSTNSDPDGKELFLIGRLFAFCKLKGALNNIIIIAFTSKIPI